MAAAAVGVAGTIAIGAGHSDPAPPSVAFHVAGHPTGLVAHGGRVWVAAPAAGGVWVLDAASGRPDGPMLRTRGTPTRIALDGQRPWIADAARGEIVTPGRPPVSVGPDVADIALGAGAVWVASEADGMVRAVPLQGSPTRALRVGAKPVALAADERYVAVVDAGAGTLVRIAARSRRLAGPTVSLGGMPVAVALAPGGQGWVADMEGGTLRRVDMQSGRPARAPVAVCREPIAVAADASDVYVVCRDRTLVRVDPATSRVRERIPLDSTPTALALDPRHVWVASADDDLVTRVDREPLT